MKKIILLTAWFLSGGLHAFSKAAENNKQLQFSNISITQNSWDYAFLRYAVTNINTGEVVELPSYMISYEIKDKAGDILSKGSDIYMSIMDDKMGSEEEYTIKVSALINGQELTHTFCQKASPKKFTMKVKATDLDNNNLVYTFTRPKFNNPALTENVNVAAADIQVDIILENTAYRIQVCTDHQAPADLPTYQALNTQITKLAAEGRMAEMTIAPRMIFRGEVYTDNQTYYQVTASGIMEVSSLDATASK